MPETQETVGQWLVSAFGGPPGLTSRHCIRLLEEVVELCLARGATPNDIRFAATGCLEGSLAEYDPDLFPDRWNRSYSDPLGIPDELADCQILLYTLAHRLGVNIHDEVDKKMRINRARKWKTLGDGTGYHVKEGEVGHQD